jgi:hypothetical protein
MDTLLTVIDAVPVFDAETDNVFVVPVVTLPNARVVPLRVNVPVAVCTVADLLELNPWQPTMVAKHSRTRASLFPRLLALHLTAASDANRSFMSSRSQEQEHEAFPLRLRYSFSVGLNPTLEQVSKVHGRVGWTCSEISFKDVNKKAGN